MMGYIIHSLRVWLNQHYQTNTPHNQSPICCELHSFISISLPNSNRTTNDTSRQREKETESIPTTQIQLFSLYSYSSLSQTIRTACRIFWLRDKKLKEHQPVRCVSRQDPFSECVFVLGTFLQSSPSHTFCSQKCPVGVMM